MKFPTEAKEQEALFAWAQYHPILREYMWANCNDGIRTPAQGARFKRRGLKPGVPDITLAWPSNGYHGLYIELKRNVKGTKVTDSQATVIASLNRAGYVAYVCKGWDVARQVILEYLNERH